MPPQLHISRATTRLRELQLACQIACARSVADNKDKVVCVSFDILRIRNLLSWHGAITTRPLQRDQLECW